MPYIYEVSFDIRPDQMNELEMGRSLDRVVGYMKTRLPAERGFVSADAWYSVDDPDHTRVVMRSEWQDWTDVEDHRKSEMLEDCAFEEFGTHLTADRVGIRTYAEVGSGPFTEVQ